MAPDSPMSLPLRQRQLILDDDGIAGLDGLTRRMHQPEKKGAVIWPDGWRAKFPTGNKMAFVTDPDGYEVELLEKK